MLAGLPPDHLLPALIDHPVVLLHPDPAQGLYCGQLPQPSGAPVACTASSSRQPSLPYCTASAVRLVWLSGRRDRGAVLHETITPAAPEEVADIRVQHPVHLHRI
jgi:hypothetical protein